MVSYHTKTLAPWERPHLDVGWPIWPGSGLALPGPPWLNHTGSSGVRARPTGLVVTTVSLSLLQPSWSPLESAFALIIMDFFVPKIIGQYFVVLNDQNLCWPWICNCNGIQRCVKFDFDWFAVVFQKFSSTFKVNILTVLLPWFQTEQFGRLKDVKCLIVRPEYISELDWSREFEAPRWVRLHAMASPCMSYLLFLIHLPVPYPCPCL